MRANHGAAGIDRITIEKIERHGVSRMLDKLEAELGSGSCRRQPVRRVFIPKPGRDEFRPLSIPTVGDRVVEAAVKTVIEPIFEADFMLLPGRQPTLRGRLDHPDDEPGDRRVGGRSSRTPRSLRRSSTGSCITARSSRSRARATGCAGTARS